MRLIPKKSKVNATLWKNFTIVDLILAIVLLAIAFAIAASNFTYKWILLIVFIGISFVMFFSDENERRYNIITVERFPAAPYPPSCQDIHLPAMQTQTPAYVFSMP